MDLKNTLGKLLGNDKETFDEIIVDQRVIDEIIKIATNADPKESMALFSGKIDDHILKITGLIFLPFEASNTSAVMQIFMMPINTDAVGSVHSHPGPSAQPSNADLIFFEKNGLFHMIICRPYNQLTIRTYDTFGNPVPYTIADLGDEVEIKSWDDEDINEFFDEDLLNELHELENEEKLNEDALFNQNINNMNYNTQFLNNMMVTNMEKNNQKNSITMQIEADGKIIEKTIELPEDYQEGDDLVIDIRTDETMGDDIDNLIVNTEKPTIDVEGTTIVDNNIDNSSMDNKSSEDLEREIEMMEADIAKIKEENEHLKKESKK